MNVWFINRVNEVISPPSSADVSSVSPSSERWANQLETSGYPQLTFWMSIFFVRSGFPAKP